MPPHVVAKSQEYLPKSDPKSRHIRKCKSVLVSDDPLLETFMEFLVSAIPIIYRFVLENGKRLGVG